ncbi:MAG TPA: hypothetical protein VNO23_05330 [Candidatus Binatia bacterium]|nr:hypothetical protein [Candidatus Binatia bacterium]
MSAVRSRTLLALGALGAAILGAPVPGRAQLGLPGFDTPNPNPMVITAQLRTAASLIREVLPALDTANSGQEALPLRPKINRIYVLIRAGMSGLKMAMDDARTQGRFIDPLVPYQHQRVTVAWNLARRPVDAFTTDGGGAWAEYREMAERQLGQALTILEEVLVLR